MKIKFIILLIISSAYSISDYVFIGAKNAALAGAVTSANNIKLFHQNPALLNEINLNFVNVEFNNQYGLKYLENQSIISSYKNSYTGRIGFYLNQASVNYFKDLSTTQQVGISKSYTLQNDRNSSLGIGVTLNYYSVKYGNSAGINGDGSLLSIEGDNFNQFGVDIGVLANLRDKYRFGAFCKNINAPQIGSGASSSYLPRRISISSTYSPIEEFSLTFELENELGRNLQIQSGIQYQLFSGLEFLVGIQSNPNRLGLGLFYSNNMIDLGWSLLSHQILPITHSFSVGYNF